MGPTGRRPCIRPESAGILILIIVNGDHCGIASPLNAEGHVLADIADAFPAIGIVFPAAVASPPRGIGRGRRCTQRKRDQTAAGDFHSDNLDKKQRSGECSGRLRTLTRVVNNNCLQIGSFYFSPLCDFDLFVLICPARQNQNLSIGGISICIIGLKFPAQIASLGDGGAFVAAVLAGRQARCELKFRGMTPVAERTFMRSLKSSILNILLRNDSNFGFIVDHPAWNYIAIDT